ncbi:hypothetical protein GCM10023185_13240 [Hymenobacter saemangeumensis]|uniref:Uncharacterized protein n=1 Tax=Hymenobacter saemangeumensis TaxID=1084522 RepID=A0ABP8I7I0_9BACT
MHTLTTEQRATWQELENLITTAPAAVQELMADFGCAVPPSVEALVLLQQVRGESFTDELFILLRASQAQAAGRFAGFTSPGTATPQQRTGFGKLLDSLYNIIKGQPTSAGSAATSTTTDPEAPEKRILGLAQPVFILACVVLLALVAVVVVHKMKK